MPDGKARWRYCRSWGVGVGLALVAVSAGTHRWGLTAGARDLLIMAGCGAGVGIGAWLAAPHIHESGFSRFRTAGLWAFTSVVAVAINLHLTARDGRTTLDYLAWILPVFGGLGGVLTRGVPATFTWAAGAWVTGYVAICGLYLMAPIVHFFGGQLGSPVPTMLSAFVTGFCAGCLGAFVGSLAPAAQWRSR